MRGSESYPYQNRTEGRSFGIILWLLLIYVFIQILANICGAFLAKSLLDSTYTPNLSSLNESLKAVILDVQFMYRVMMWAGVIYAILWGSFLHSMLRKLRYARKIFLCMAILSVITPVVVGPLAGVDNETIITQQVGQVMIWLPVNLFFIFYLFFSRRAKETFVN